MTDDFKGLDPVLLAEFCGCEPGEIDESCGNVAFLMFSMLDAIKLNQIALSAFGFGFSELGHRWKNEEVPFTGLDLRRANLLNTTVNRAFLAPSLEPYLRYVVHACPVGGGLSIGTEFFTLDMAKAYVEMFEDEYTCGITAADGTQYILDRTQPDGWLAVAVPENEVVTPPPSIMVNPTHGTKYL